MQKLALLALATFALGGCIVERDSRREEQAVLAAPPPPPPDDRPVARDDYPPPNARDDYAARDYDEPPPPVERDVDEEVFYERLSPYGHWTFVAPYGRVWIPAVSFGWRPYYYGHWVLTDWGWTFASDDPWGWAAYHYGRWNWGVGVGWYWVPGRVWAPAWVEWRYGGGYVTWCPLGPRGVIFGHNHPAWVAVPERHFTRPISTVAIPTRNTNPIVRSASPLSGPHATVARNGQFGPPVARVESATGSRVRPVSATELIGRPHTSEYRNERIHAGTGGDPMRSGGDPIRSPTSPRARRDGVENAPRPRSGGAEGSPRVRGGDADTAPRVRGESPEGSPRVRGGGEAPAPRTRDPERAPRPRDDSGSAPVAPRVRGGGDAPAPRAKDGGGSTASPPSSGKPHVGKKHNKD